MRLHGLCGPHGAGGHDRRAAGRSRRRAAAARTRLVEAAIAVVLAGRGAAVGRAARGISRTGTVAGARAAAAAAASRPHRLRAAQAVGLLLLQLLTALGTPVLEPDLRRTKANH